MSFTNASANTNAYQLTNEELLLVNVLNTMYNDNLRQIQTTTVMLGGLIESNHQIRHSLTSLLGQSPTLRRRRHTAGPLVLDAIHEFTVYPNGTADTDEWFAQSSNQFMRPVEIYPAPAQIEIATRVARYGDIARPINSSCPISMEEFNDNDTVTVIRHCGHLFHTEPLMNWFRTNCRCPVCRFDVRDYQPQTPTDLLASAEPVSRTERRTVTTNELTTLLANMLRRSL